MIVYTISIDRQIYQARFHLDRSNALRPEMLVLGKSYSDSCLNIDPSRGIIRKIHKRQTCHLNPPLPENRVLDILTPIGILICLEQKPQVFLEDDATIGSVTLSRLKVMEGIPSTAYSKYGFYSPDYPQSEIDRQAQFFRAHTGMDILDSDLQRQLDQMEIPRALPLTKITHQLYLIGHGALIDEIYEYFFPLPTGMCQLDPLVWSRYASEHRIELLRTQLFEG